MIDSCKDRQEDILELSVEQSDRNDDIYAAAYEL